MKRILSYLFLFFGVWGWGQEYDLNALYQMADTANLSIVNTRLDIAANREQKNIFLSSRLPQVSAVADYRYNAIIPGQIVPADFFGGPPGTFAEVKFGVPFNLSNTIQVNQFLYNSQLNYGLAALAINAQIVEIQQQVVKQDVRFQIASAYFNVQAINQQLAFLDKNVANMNALIKNMEVLFANGMVIPTEIDKLKINKINITNGIFKLENTRKQLLQLIGILVGFGEGKEITLVKDEAITKPMLIEYNEVVRPEIQLLRAQKQMNIEEYKGTKMAYYPNLSFYSALNYNYNLKGNFRTGIPSAFLGLRLDWELFDGNEKKNKLKMNLITREKLENQERLASQQLNLVTDNAKREIAVQTANLAMNQEQLVLAERLYEVSKKQFSGGTISTNELLQAETSVQQAQSNIVSSYLQLRLAELSLLKSISQLK
ncbi:MAG: TolC family protein [Flavobacteriales bacterium]|jgi:outer membrane protein